MDRPEGYAAPFLKTGPFIKLYKKKRVLDFTAKIKKYSINIEGHSTSISLEPVFWQLLNYLAERELRSTRAIITLIDKKREGNLSMAIRIHVMKYFFKKR